MITKYSYRGVHWIDLDCPTYEEVTSIAEQFKLNAVLASELLTPTLKSKVDLYREYLYLVLHFPAIKNFHVGSTSQEIDFIVGKNFIITAHYDTIDPLQEFAKVFEVQSILDRGDMGDHAGYVLYHLLQHIYKRTEDEIEHIKERTATIEQEIFSGKETQMVFEISKVSHDILDITNAIRHHENTLDSLSVAAVRFFGSDFEFPMVIIKNEQFRIRNELNNHKDLISELRATNNTLVSTKQNEAMKQLSVSAFIFLPLGIMATLLQIDFVSRPHDFLFTIAGLVILGLFLYAFSKRKKWL
ncbi:MAG: hypothetical protein A2664_03250 [Candidatus Taylorbacteria bacterium RIFCSPHIGHO2_01_FULL_46_22b]|uniref:Magnesium transporter CorA n=1 Tax=Candidatus Taylorbacteria bacterium RIFCSPHIGHO2_01_FULL_46_22b TaxID=1802301 RepID=A0A1G2M3J2_9BACT|nr:MAG: hypothetical protein A2664_03250 [Candidatus Taylorbacteria bacterium RIFCSPHIGHO2_01_FULL_46_22b]